MKLRTIGLVSVLALGLLTGALAVDAQKAGKVYRIGYLSGRSASPHTSPRHIAFRQRLRDG